MSVDESVTKDLVEILEDGKDGFAKGADKVAEDAPEVAAKFREFSAQRDRFATELRGLAKNYGDEVHESGSAAGTVHRGWMALKDALSGSDASGVLDAAEQGEDHAVRAYKKALDGELSDSLRAVVARQAAEVKAAHDVVKAMRDAGK